MIANRVEAGDAEPRDAGDRGEGFAAKSEGPHAHEIIELADLRRGMPLQRQQGVFARHAATVVAHLDPLLAAVFEQDLDRVGAGVDGVLHQLLDHRCGPLDDLAGGNLIHQLIRENADAGHFQIIEVARSRGCVVSR